MYAFVFSNSDYSNNSLVELFCFIIISSHSENSGFDIKNKVMVLISHFLTDKSRNMV